jgi:hypothetical protein
VAGATAAKPEAGEHGPVRAPVTFVKQKYGTGNLDDIYCIFYSMKDTCWHA